MSCSPPFSVCCGALLAVSLLAWPGAPVVGQYVEPSRYEITGVFQDSKIRESSGVAASRRHPGVLWTHNDGGDKPMLYVTNLSGADLGHFRLAGAQAEDWEDIALGPCPESGTACLYIADTGDNLERRRDVAIYIVEEPQELPPRGKRAREDLPARRMEVRYPDGSHDVEAMAVAPDGEILLINKGRRGRIRLYRIPAGATSSQSVTAETGDALDIVPQRTLGRLVTGAAISPSGRRLAVRTYTEIILFRLDGASVVREGEPCWLGLREPQGEAIDFLDEETLVLTSEARLGIPGMITKVRCW